MNKNYFPLENSQSSSIAFVDSGLIQTDLLLEELEVDQVILLDDQTNALGKITEALAQFEQLDSIHIFSHGSNGALQLGNSVLDRSSLDTYATQLESWGEALTDQGDLLLYGCHMGTGSEGSEFLQSLQTHTQADIAASDDLTGYGGDWSLEITLGQVETAVALSEAGQAMYEGTLAVIGESGTLENINEEWALVTLDQSYLDPVVVAGPPSINGGHQSTVRVRNVTNDSFEVRIDEWEFHDEFHTTESFGYLVVEAGTHTLADGTVLQAGKSENNSDWENIFFATAFEDAPLVFAQTTSENEASAVTERVRNVSTTDFNFRLQEEEAADDIHVDESVDWIAIAPASGSLGERSYVADQVSSNHLDANISFNNTFNTGETPVLLAHANTLNGGDTFALRQRFVDEGGTTLVLEEERSFDPETWHVFEDIAYLALEPGLIDTVAPDPDTPPPDTTDIFALVSAGPILVNEAEGSVSVTATRTGAAAPATLEYTTNEIGSADAAQAGIDYTTPTFDERANTGEIVFEVGETEKSFTIPIVDDALVEGDETFAVGLQNPSGSLGAPRTALITIVDDDSATTLSVSDTALTVAEDTATASITVQRSGDSSGTASVEFNTLNDTAVADEDYTATAGTLNFEAGQLTQTLTVPILEDALVEGDETFTVALSNAVGGTLEEAATSVTIIDNDLELGDLNRTTVVEDLFLPTTFDWTPDGQYMLVAQKNGIVQVIEDDVLRSTPLVDLSVQVNNTGDRGLLGFAVHPDFSNTPYVYLLYTYDPPETVGNTGLAGPDGDGNRPARLVRLTVDPATMVADPDSLTVLAGTNSTWANTSEPESNSTGDLSIPPSGIVNGTTITAPSDQIDEGTQDNDPDRPGIQNQNIRDYIATDNLSHSGGDLEFGPDGYLYFSTGDGTSFNFADPRGVRVQDINNLSGKVLRIDPITGEGVPTNPFFDGDPNSNQSKVFYYGLRNPYRLTFDPVTQLPIIGEVGWNNWEEINTGVAGSNFGWPYLEGPDPTGDYQDLEQAIAFYDNGNRNNPEDNPAVLPLLTRSHGAPDDANAITVGDFFNNDTLIFGDVNNGTLYAATFDDNRQISNVQVFDTDAPFVVDMKIGPDGRLYGVDFANFAVNGGTLLRWEPVA